MLKTVCLNMIVKNESKVIRRCLASLIDYIDYWVIVDTGSTDDTCAIIREVLDDIPGDLYHRPWVDFSHNRNEALDLAKGKGDYLLFIDADDKLVFSHKFQRPTLNLDSYLVNYHKEQCVTHRVLLINNKLDWRWSGVVHEAIESPQAKKSGIFPETYIESSKDGYRSQDPDKFKKDIQLLEEALSQDLENSRYVFHLGVFCEEAADLPKALKYFYQRSAMGGWDQEVFYALFRVAALQESLEMAPEIFLSSYKKAYEFRPSRAEPLFWMALYYMRNKKYGLSYDLLKTAANIPLPQDSIYVVNSIYEYGTLLCLSDCAFNLGKYTESLNGYLSLLSNPKLPSDRRVLIEKCLPMVRLKAGSRKDPAPLKRFMS